MVPAIYLLFAIDVLFIEYGVHDRNVTFEAVRDVFRPEEPSTVDEVRTTLGDLVHREHYGPPDPPKKPFAHTSFILSTRSKLHLVVRYDENTGRIDSYSLYYFYSGEVNLDTREGLGGYMYPPTIIAAALALYLSMALVWYWLYPRLTSWRLYAVSTAYTVVVLVSIPILGISTLNFWLSF
jgi:hypothetical protein